MKGKTAKPVLITLLGILVILGVFVLSPIAQSEDLVGTAVAETVAAFIAKTATISVKEMKIDIFAYQTIEAYFTGTPTPLPKPGNVETAIAGTLEAMKPTATYTDEDREIATAVHETVVAFLPTATPTPNEIEPLKATIEAMARMMTGTPVVTTDPLAAEQGKVNATLASLNATLAALQRPTQPPVYPYPPQPQPPVYTYPPTQPPAYYPPPSSVPCNQFTFIRDLSIPDGSYMKPNERFTKIWQVRNTGSCTWNPGYYLALFKGTQMGEDRVNVDRSVPPGGVIDLSIKLTAPPSVGNYRGHFTMYTPNGIRFMTSSGSQDGIWVDIRVRPDDAPPSTPDPSSETWRVNISHEMNGGHWGAISINPHTITAPINQSMPANGLEQERNIEPIKENAIFLGWAVRFTNAANNVVIYDSGSTVWDLNHPFDYYPSNPREMNCVMTAQWMTVVPIDTGIGNNLDFDNIIDFNFNKKIIEHLPFFP